MINVLLDLLRPFMVVEQNDDGSWAMTCPSREDFVVYGATREEVEADWKSAMTSHVMGIAATTDSNTSTGNPGGMTFHTLHTPAL